MVFSPDVSASPVELGKPYRHPGSSLRDWDLMEISLRIRREQQKLNLVKFRGKKMGSGGV